MQAESILLEPWYAFRIQADSRQLGRILSDIQRLQGVFEPPRQQENRSDGKWTRAGGGFYKLQPGAGGIYQRKRDVQLPVRRL